MIRKLFNTALVLILLISTVACNRSIPGVHKLSSSFAATDALGRKLPGYKETGGKREGKYVGMFYYIWHGAHGDTVYDITKILAEKSDSPKWGPQNAFHFWGEPEEGYYRAEDPWVIRRNLQMLSHADIDFIFFDVTNSVTYLDTVKALCEVSLQMRAEGIKTPQISFMTHTNSGETVNKIYTNFYRKELYKELWFYWQGKPLILGDKTDPKLIQEAKDFFTFKFSWAGTDTKNNPDHWQWLDWTPQDYGWSEDPNVPEQITVTTAFHPSNPHGKSFSKDTQPAVDENYETGLTEQGLYFAEQWEHALRVDPQVIMVTQWNEWIAQRFIWNKGDGMYAGRPIKNGDTHFVDVFNMEFNRDIAPMKGGYTDSLYYQLISYVRKFKGMDEPVEVNILKTIDMYGNFSDWNDIDFIFTDPKGDTMHRDFKGYDPKIKYTNGTGRNDIIGSKVAYDKDNLYFYVNTAADLTPHTDPSWMHLYIDGDRSKDTGWEGYDYAVNINVIDETKTILSEYKDGQWSDKETVAYKYAGNQLHIKIPRNLIAQNKKVSFEFKWADNPGPLYDITGFFLNGDTAPDRRATFLLN